MNWLHFILWVAVVYSLYYLTVVLLDVMAKGRSPAEQNFSGELTFSENIQPQRLDLETETQEQAPTSNEKQRQENYQTAEQVQPKTKPVYGKSAGTHPLDPPAPDRASIAITAQPEVIASGGLTLKAAFAMAREESLLYTRPVSFY